MNVATTNPPCQGGNQAMRKKICLALNSPIGGGAERFMIHLLNNLSRERFDIHLLLLNKEGEYFHQIKKDIAIMDLNIRSFELNKPISPVWIWKLGRALQEIQPAVTFSTMGSTNLMCILAKSWLRLKAKVVIREAGILSHHLEEDPLAAVKKMIYKMCLPGADWIVFPTQAMAIDLEFYLDCRLKTKRIIPNFLDTQYLDQKLQEPLAADPFNLPTDRKIIVSMGRLEKIKGFDIGIEAFLEIQRKIPAYYWILGQGGEENNLKELAKQLGIAENIFFLGFQENPYRFLKRADVFLLPSRSEGFPNALLEAMYCRLPSVAARYSVSANELLGISEGILVPNQNPPAMAEALVKILTDPALADSMRENARRKASQFAKEHVVRQYEQLFLELVS